MLDDIKQNIDSTRDLSDQEIRRSVEDLRERLEKGHAPASNEITVPAFALVNEAARRTIGISFFDVQFLAGLALARGCVAEMQTGEGKTFVAALPAFVHALRGRGVHVITSNAYLAERDFEQLAPVFQFLGVSTALLPEGSASEDKQAAYACDVTYGTGYEFGFDYLRDQVLLRQVSNVRLGRTFRDQLRGDTQQRQQTAQRGLAFAIVDEIDSVLIDDATSPLVLSGQTSAVAEDADAHIAARELIATLVETDHYQLDTAAGSIRLTDSGSRFIYENPDAIPLKVLLRPWSEYVEQALRAKWLFKKDGHYIATDDLVQIVDEYTGRIFSQRSWRDGLHQAIEAKEGVTITAEKRPIARITRQKFFRLYDDLCGMTGTAVGSESEFWEFYRLPVVAIRCASHLGELCCRHVVLPTPIPSGPPSLNRYDKCSRRNVPFWSAHARSAKAKLLPRDSRQWESASKS